MKNKAAQQLGRRGGKVTSETKAEAARKNGLNGGRPRRDNGSRRDAAASLIDAARAEERGLPWRRNAAAEIVRVDGGRIVVTAAELDGKTVRWAHVFPDSCPIERDAAGRTVERKSSVHLLNSEIMAETTTTHVVQWYWSPSLDGLSSVKLN